MIADEEAARAFVAARCDGAAMARLDRLVSMLAVENGRQNLIAAASLGTVWQRHIADSAQLLDYVPRGPPGLASLEPFAALFAHGAQGDRYRR